MEAARANLKLVDPETGELVDPGRCPGCERKDLEAEEMDRKFKGLLLENRKLRSDKQAELWGHPDRPLVELLHKLHAHGTKVNPDSPTRKAKLDSGELENALRVLKRLGLQKCIQAVVGLTWDPGYSPKAGKNGKHECFNKFELCFRTTANAITYAERAPLGWEPNVEKISEISGLPVDWLNEQLRKGQG